MSPPPLLFWGLFRAMGRDARRKKDQDTSSPPSLFSSSSPSSLSLPLSLSSSSGSLWPNEGTNKGSERKPMYDRAEGAHSNHFKWRQCPPLYLPTYVRTQYKVPIYASDLDFGLPQTSFFLFPFENRLRRRTDATAEADPPSNNPSVGRFRPKGTEALLRSSPLVRTLGRSGMVGGVWHCMDARGRHRRRRRRQGKTDGQRWRRRGLPPKSGDGVRRGGGRSTMFERQEKEQSWDVGDEFAEKRRKDPKAMF